MAGDNWTRCREWIVPVLVDATEDEVLTLLASRHAQLWPGERSAMVTQLHTEDMSMHVWLAGGDLDELLALRPGMEAWARAQGCACVTINGRRGWMRVLERHGYQADGDELRKALT